MPLARRTTIGPCRRKHSLQWPYLQPAKHVLLGSCLATLAAKHPHCAAAHAYFAAMSPYLRPCVVEPRLAGMPSVAHCERGVTSRYQ